MKTLTEDDLLDIAAYEKVRDERIGSVIEIKKRRRIQVGPMVTLLFENRETIRSQIQEIMRAERLVDAEAIREELDACNELIPRENELSATLFIEVEDPRGVRGVLDRFIGLDEEGRVVLRFESGKTIPGVFEKGHSREDRISAVHFVRFRLDEEGARALRTGPERIELVIHHPGYEASAEIAGDIRRSLAEDL